MGDKNDRRDSVRNMAAAAGGPGGNPGAPSGAQVPAVESPCQGVCVVGFLDQRCHGCGRTIEQIQNWLSYSEQQRKTIMQTIKERSGGR